MAFPHKLQKITISGICYNGNEQWSTGFYMGLDSQDATDPTDLGLAAVDTAWKTFFQSNQVNIGTNWVTTQVKGQLVDLIGHVDPTKTKYRTISPTYQGAGSSQKMPPQLSLVASLRNTVQRGMATKGRMYLPGVSIAIGDDGHITTTNAGYVATQLATFLSACNASVDLPGSVVLASKGNVVTLTEGAIRNVTNVLVGNVYDTQRRRRNQLVETYQNGNVA